MRDFERVRSGSQLLSDIPKFFLHQWFYIKLLAAPYPVSLEFIELVPRKKEQKEGASSSVYLRHYQCNALVMVECSSDITNVMLW